MTNRVWITRTEPAAERSASAWAAAGFRPISAPLLKIRPVRWDGTVADGSRLIFTSANAVRHCGLRGGAQHVYAVGDATARAAREAGFDTVLSGKGDWQTLMDIIDSKDGPFLHLSGREVRGRIVETLRKCGAIAERAIVYESVAVGGWPIDPEAIDGVALYSPKAAETLMSLPPRNLARLTAYCLSETVATPLESMDVRIAAEPNEDALIACARNGFPGRSGTARTAP
ncbi:MAG: uroporphyrinogen-III synthase [Litorimonas sp.]